MMPLMVSNESPDQTSFSLESNSEIFLELKAAWG